MRSAKEIMESLEIAKGLCEGKTNESWNARKAGRVMAELIAPVSYTHLTLPTILRV